MNVEKTVTILFHHDNRPPEHLPTIYLQDHLLNVAQKQRHLGIVFQHDLRWAEHITCNTILNKSLTSLKNLLRLRNSLNSSALSYLYRTYIRPKLEYACIALSPLPINTLDRLERFQRKGARICLRLPLYTPVNHSHLLHQLVYDSPIHKSLHLFNLLPEDIKNTHDRTLFKSQISALLTNSVCSCSHHPLPYSP